MSPRISWKGFSANQHATMHPEKLIGESKQVCNIKMHFVLTESKGSLSSEEQPPVNSFLASGIGLDLPWHPRADHDEVYALSDPALLSSHLMRSPLNSALQPSIFGSLPADLVS